MYFFNALTAAAKTGKEQGGKNLIKKGWVKLSVACVASLGEQHPISQVLPRGKNIRSSPGKKCGEPKSTSSILNNVSGLQSDVVYPTFPHTRAGGKEYWRMQNSPYVARQSKISTFPGVVMAETSHHYQKTMSEKSQVQPKFLSHMIM